MRRAGSSPRRSSSPATAPARASASWRFPAGVLRGSAYAVRTNRSARPNRRNASAMVGTAEGASTALADPEVGRPHRRSRTHGLCDRRQRGVDRLGCRRGDSRAQRLRRRQSVLKRDHESHVATRSLLHDGPRARIGLRPRTEVGPGRSDVAAGVIECSAPGNEQRRDRGEREAEPAACRRPALAALSHRRSP